MKYRIIKHFEKAVHYDGRKIDSYFTIQKKILFWWVDYTELQGFPLEDEVKIFESLELAERKIVELLKPIKIKTEIIPFICRCIS